MCPKQLVHKAAQQLDSFQSAYIQGSSNQQVDQRLRNDAKTDPKRWVGLQGHKLKINWDAIASSFTMNSTRLEGLIRDSAGEVLVSFCNSYAPMLEPKVAETMALRKSMSICWELGLSNILFEGDCLQVARAVYSNRPSEDELSPIIHDIHCMLENAQDWQVCFAPRDANRAAHCLAKLACNCPSDFIWIEECPEHAFNVILEDKLCNGLFTLMKFRFL